MLSAVAMISIVLKPGRERSLLRRHPWIFSNAVARVDGEPASGETVRVLGADGRFLGAGAWSPRSQIRVRMWTFDPAAEVGPELIRTRIAAAIERRLAALGRVGPGARRLVHGESDGLPGLIVDRYAGWVVCQFAAAGVERFKKEIVLALERLVPAGGIWERSDVDARKQEGFELATGLLSGDEPPELVEIREGSCRFLVDVRRGQKTGFYLDQRENRARLADYCRGAEVLNVFAYTGAFGLAALKAGAARVTNVEASASALGLAARQVLLNALDPGRVEQVEGDAFQVLRQYRDAGRQFDAVVLDPPRFVESKSHLVRACRGYKDINLLAFKLLRPGGVLLTFSCSGLLEPALFQKVVADAALDAGREAWIERRLGQGRDHPTLLSFPEGSYLKGLVCRVEGPRASPAPS